jgi:hypothetical protein
MTTPVRAFRAGNMTELHDKLCNKIIHAGREDLDVISGVDVQMHNCVAAADSMKWDFNLKTLWLTPQRWTMMVRQYVDRDGFIEWVEKATKYIGTNGRGMAHMRTHEVKARGGEAFGNKETRRWGSCMLGITYKAQPAPQITLYSRTCYLGYLSGLDLSVAWMAGKYLAAELGMDVEDMAFVWMNEAMQYHNFKSMAFLLNNPDPVLRKQYRRWLRFSENKLKETGDWDYVNSRPALQLTRKWLQKLILDDANGKTLGDMTYNTYRRIRRRYHTEVLGYERAQEFEGWSYYKKGPKEGEQKEFFKAYQPLDDCWISDLDFKGIHLPFSPGSLGAPLLVTGDHVEFDDLDDDE